MWQKMLQMGAGGSETVTGPLIPQFTGIGVNDYIIVEDSNVGCHYSAPNQYQNEYPYYMFDRSSKFYRLSDSALRSTKIQISFEELVELDYITINPFADSALRINTFEIQASDDGLTYDKVLITGTCVNSNTDQKFEVTGAKGKYKYYQLYVKTASTRIGCQELQFYGTVTK